MGSPVNLILPGRAGWAPSAACAWGLTEQESLLRSELVPPSQSWVVGTCFPEPRGSPPALHLKLEQIPNWKGEFGGSAWKLSCLRTERGSELW